MSLHAGTRRALLSTQAAAAGGWWLSGGIAAANCLAAYTPKGAASLAASYDNNAAPGNGLPDGTYDVTSGTDPAFNAATGWGFVGASSTYLNTGVVPTGNTWSAFVRYSDGAGTSDAYVFGSYSLATNYSFAYRYTNGFGSRQWWYDGGLLSISGIATSGVLGFAGLDPYQNGIDMGAISAVAITTNTFPVFIGCRNSNGTAAAFFTGNVQAFAIYNIALLPAQVAALSAAMAAL